MRTLIVHFPAVMLQQPNIATVTIMIQVVIRMGYLAVQQGALSLCSLPAANRQISVLTGQKSQLTG